MTRCMHALTLLPASSRRAGRAPDPCTLALLETPRDAPAARRRSRTGPRTRLLARPRRPLAATACSFAAQATRPRANLAVPPPPERRRSAPRAAAARCGTAPEEELPVKDDLEYSEELDNDLKAPEEELPVKDDLEYSEELDNDLKAPEEELPVKDDSEYSEELDNDLKGCEGDYLGDWED